MDQSRDRPPARAGTNTAAKWRKRFFQEGVEGLGDRQRPGRPRAFPAAVIMARTRHRNPRTAMRYVEPGAEAVADVTELLSITPRRRG
jgi:hypothetical protein